MSDIYINESAFISVIRTLIGEGNIKFYDGSSKRFEKGDVLIYLNNEIVELFKCQVSGNYTLPNTESFKKINLKG